MSSDNVNHSASGQWPNGADSSDATSSTIAANANKFKVQLRKTHTYKSADQLDSCAGDLGAPLPSDRNGDGDATGACADEAEFTRRWPSGSAAAMRYASDRRNSRSAEHIPTAVLAADGVARSASGLTARRKNSVPDAFNGELLQTLLKIGKDKTAADAISESTTATSPSITASITSASPPDSDDDDSCDSPASTMMPPLQSQPSNVPAAIGGDAQAALIAPKKLANPCLESTDRKNLHRELMFNQKIGKNVLNQKSELQKALQKQKERQQLNAQQQDVQQKQDQTLGGELGRVIMQRAQRLEQQQNGGGGAESENDHQLNSEYLKIRAKLRATDAK